jgi:hypothetical protein
MAGSVSGTSRALALGELQARFGFRVQIGSYTRNLGLLPGRKGADSVPVSKETGRVVTSLPPTCLDSRLLRGKEEN